MRRIILTIAILLYIGLSFSQNNNDSLIIKDGSTSSPHVCNVVGFVPSNVDVINGWGIGWLMLGGGNNDNYVSINGLYTNLSPIQVFWGMMLLPRLALAPLTTKNEQENVDELGSSLKHPDKINGLALSIVDVSDTHIVNGLQISLLTHRLYKLNGISATLGLSSYYSFKGLMVSGLVNVTHTGKGLQIGLVNRTDNMTGVQIGLWNKIGKRGFPIINMSFKKKK